MADFGTLNFSVAFAPTSAFPLDSRSYFESLEAAEVAAQRAAPAGSTDSIYYYGQHIVVVADGAATLYVIQPDNTLQAVGGGPIDHSALTGRELPDQHPIAAISGLSSRLAETLEGEVITNAEIATIWDNIMNS